MKKIILAITAIFFLINISGFTGKQVSGYKSTREDPGPAWINCDLGYLHTCYEDTYYVMDGEPGDTYEWWLDATPYGTPDVYLGSGPSVNIELHYKDVLILKVNSIYYGEYEYYDTAWGCDE
jgi:hypothetical protein